VRRLGLVLSCALLLGFSLAAAQPPVAERPILILISIDGFRWDYLNRFKPPTLSALATRGVVADGLIPSFPSKTFPNHYTVVTGLYPDRHGIVSNTMRDPMLPGVFTLTNVDVQQDTRWWGGVPLWVTVEQQGQIAATMFWPGSDVEIAGDRPTFWRKYDHQAWNNTRVDQLLSWLRQPEPGRPSFLTLYFAEVDSAGHDFGPESPEVRTAVDAVDAAIARLIEGIESAGVTSRTNLVIVSDHGMAAQSLSRVIVLDDFVDVATLDVVDWSPIMMAAPRSGSAEDLYQALKDKHPSLAVYRNRDLPARFRLAGHPRFPQVIGVADDGWEITSRARLARDPDGPHGTHGYDPALESMHGLFVATGPAFRQRMSAPRFENVHIYELLCRVLGVRPEGNDGDPKVTAGFFR
jgi:predicted AlkP superfamily pyrophosphatase or phosphodiesterase